MLRTLIYYWRVQAAVAIGAAVATAVLAGALLVGDSVRGSLRDLTLERLGGIDWALASERLFDERLAERLTGDAGFADRFGPAAPALVLRGAAVHGDSGARASQVSIQGVDERFAVRYGVDPLDFDRAEGQIYPSVILNAALAKELGAGVGDPLLLSFGRWSEIPRDTLMGERDPGDVLGSARLTVRAILPDKGIGRFALEPHQQNPFNAFVALGGLQRSLGARGKINSLFAGGGSGDGSADPNTRLASALSLDDLGLAIAARETAVTLESREFVIRPSIDAAVDETLAETGLAGQRTVSYLANSMRIGERTLPYSMVCGLDPGDAPWSSLILDDGSAAPPISPDGILLNRWAAEDLAAAVGDTLEMEYYEVGADEQLRVASRTFTVEGIVRLEGLGADRSLTPEYPGIEEAADIADWDPPFPVELAAIRDKDEAYWDSYGGAPKAFVAEATGHALWRTRFGSTTQVRIGSAAGDPAAAASRFERALIPRLDPASFGYLFRPVKRQGLEASAGATDFSGLFIGFSFFLIVSAAMLVGLLFGLGVEQRAKEVGLLLAVGYPVAKVVRRLLVEGTLLAAAGALAGLAGAVLYAGSMMVALRTIWLDAVGSSQLFLHVVPASLAIGWALSVVVVLFAIWISVRRLRKVPPPALLGGGFRAPAVRDGGRIAPVLAPVCGLGAIGLTAASFASGQHASPGLTFGAGALLLVAGLAAFSLWCKRSGSSGGAFGRGPAVVSMAARNSAWSPGRSMLSVALVACACFVIVTVAANRHQMGDEVERRDSGTGGYGLVAESDVNLHQQLGRRDDRFELGFESEDAKLLDEVEVMQLRLVPGDDASCLNLYRPERPRLLGVPPVFVGRGGFDFQRHADLPDGADSPWRLLEQPLEEGVIPAIGDANSVQWILHLGLGQELEMEDEAGRPLRLRIVGMLATSIFQSELLISEADLLEHFPSRTGYGYFLFDSPPASRAALSERVEAVLQPFGFDATTTADKLAGYQVVEHTYLSTFQLLGGLGLLLGTVGLGVVLMRNVIERRGELATLRAFGFRRASLGWMVLAENAFLLLAGITIGTVAALTAVAPRLATIHVPWLSLFGTLLAVLLVGMVASLAAVSGALRIPLLPALKAE